MQENRHPTFSLQRLNETELALFAQLLSVVVHPGDVIALEGDLGAGKTTFARAFIRAFLGEREEEIPSPTYTLVQTYQTPRMNIAHFDLYRLGDPDELLELGLEHALGVGVAVVEWPCRAGDLLGQDRLVLKLSNPAENTIPADERAQDVLETRDIQVIGLGSWDVRSRRLGAMQELIVKSGCWKNLESITYLAGDASARRYARLNGKDGSRALVMDWPQVIDKKTLRGGRTYNQLAHIADNVAPFVAIANALSSEGFSAPRVLGADIDNGLLVLEDLGDQVFINVVDNSLPMRELWRAATDTLVALRTVPVPETVAVSPGHEIKLAHFDRDAMTIELELLADWYWPLVHNAPMPQGMRTQFSRVWHDVISRLCEEPRFWCLRDYHSPNLVWMAERSGVTRVGLIDFQDAVAGPAAYDLVSLLQDARVDVPINIEAEMLDHYCQAVSGREPAFDREAFVFGYGALGAQRNTKILGIFARLAQRDQKKHYLAHFPRIWGYLERNLQHPDLSTLANWYEKAFKKEKC